MLPADGIGAAAEKWDFGTSRWQLCNRLHQLPERVEGATPTFVAAEERTSLSDYRTP